MLQRFEVALWRYWPSLMPEYIGYVDASHAFAAVECLMRVYRLAYAAHGTARALDGSIIYRGFRMDVLVSTGVRQGQAWEEVASDG